ncbi:uncharacterized protein LOC127741202 [Arachis duranensis]|uniref:Uncharacterized protein LOC127741202 n=1 Tax=Arachis duranensis TaxID=130453 RepID=A0A9C6WBN8_ARADU|nr:uncharacterized protein LOC127741202 [Arachis duranensis]
MGQDHCRLDSKVNAYHILTMVKTDPTISIKVLQGGVENHFGYKASYRKVWITKQKIIARIYSDWEESYNELSYWLFTMYLGATCDTHWPGSVDTVMFRRVFWTVPPCVEFFKHCKPLISIDGTHFYGKYGGTLLMSIAQDGNANILPIVFAIVEGETKKHVTPQHDVLVILDRHKSVDATLNADGSLWKPLHTFQEFCTRHIVANFMTHFKNKDLKKVLVNTTYSMSEREFAHHFGRLRGENVAITNWIEEIPRSH